MTKTIKLVGALLALCVSGSLFAQTSTNPTPDLGSGVLGHRYADAGFQYTDINHTSYDAWGLTALVNNPITPNIDISLDYTYSWLKGLGSNHDNDINVNAIYYNNFGAYKPYVGVSLGYDWTRTAYYTYGEGGDTIIYRTDSDNRVTFGGRVGVEYQLNSQVVVTAEALYSSDFKRNNDSNAWAGTLTGRYWFTKQIAAYATVAWLEYGDFGYGGGVTYKF